MRVFVTTFIQIFKCGVLHIVMFDWPWPWIGSSRMRPLMLYWETILNLGISKSPYMVVPPVKKSLLQTINVSLFVLRQLKPLRFFQFYLTLFMNTSLKPVMVVFLKWSSMLTGPEPCARVISVTNIGSIDRTPNEGMPILYIWCN